MFSCLIVQKTHYYSHILHYYSASLPSLAVPNASSGNIMPLCYSSSTQIILKMASIWFLIQTLTMLTNKKILLNGFQAQTLQAVIS